jgi:8-amino-7-oxononanoate synthase
MDELLERRIAELGQAGLLRDPNDTGRNRAEAAAARLGVPMLDAASNDYLALTPAEVDLTEPWGAGASRLVHGTFDPHRELEACLASWVGLPEALLFSSAYAANVGAVSALAQRGDHVISARLNHASIIDGARLSRAEVSVVDPDDLDHVERALAKPRVGAAWLIVESYYSMDGTSPDLVALRRIASRRGAHLVVDEAHALGVFGPKGAGLCAELGVQPDVLVLGLGKSLGLQGGAVVGSTALKIWLWNRARSFVFSTATSPALAQVGVAQVRQVQGADEQRKRLARTAASLRTALASLGTVRFVAGAHGPILSLVLGASDAARRAADHFIERVILVQAIRPPTVPDGSARLRLTVKATFSADDAARIVAAAEGACI